VAIAAYLKETSDVSNAWLAEKLDTCSSIYVSKHVGLVRGMADHPAAEWLERLRATKD
jgi:hypothetical protein